MQRTEGVALSCGTAFQVWSHSKICMRVNLIIQTIEYEENRHEPVETPVLQLPRVPTGRPRIPKVGAMPVWVKTPNPLGYGLLLDLFNTTLYHPTLSKTWVISGDHERSAAFHA